MTTQLQWEDMEGNLHQSESNQQGDLEEVEENELFIHFVENYEQAYTYDEKHNEPGRCIGSEHILLHRVLSNQHLILHFCPQYKFALNT